MRLNNETREAIRDAVLTHRFADSKEALRQRRQKLYERGAKLTHPENFDEALKLVPLRHFSYRFNVTIVVNGRRHIFQQRWHNKLDDIRDYALAKNMPLPEGIEVVIEDNASDNWQTQVLLDAEDPLGQDVEDLIRDEDQLAEEQAKARLDAEALLRSLNTVKQLRDQWPEVIPLIEPLGIISPSAKKLPVSVGLLNEQLGLPPE